MPAPKLVMAEEIAEFLTEGERQHAQDSPVACDGVADRFHQVRAPEVGGRFIHLDLPLQDSVFSQGGGASDGGGSAVA